MLTLTLILTATATLTVLAFVPPLPAEEEVIQVLLLGVVMLVLMVLVKPVALVDVKLAQAV